MTSNRRTLIVLGVGLLAATAASVGVYTAISRIPVRTVEIATHHAVVAIEAMPNGTRLSKDALKLVDWPAKTPVEGGFDKIEDVIDRGLVASVVANEPIVESKLAPKEAGAGLPPSIPDGMRAMSVKVNEVVGVAGFVVPGTRVDVLVAIRQQPQNDSMARVIVSNVQVLTAGTRYDQEGSKDGKPIPTTVVTLAVNPEDAERIALGQSEGQIMLALRNPLDVAPSVTSGIRTAGLLGTGLAAKAAPARQPTRRAPVAAPAPAPDPAPAQLAAAPPPPPERFYSVEAIRAAKRTEEVVR